MKKYISVKFKHKGIEAHVDEADGFLYIEGGKQRNTIGRGSHYFRLDELDTQIEVLQKAKRILQENH